MLPAPIAPYVVRPQARRARVIALVLSVVAVAFSLGFGVYIRRTIRLFDPDDPQRYAQPFVIALVLLLIALLFRMAASICELLWLERTWSNLPEALRKVGPVDKVTSGLVVGLSFVPGISWVWKLGLIMAVSDGFERMRLTIPFRAPIPRKLGLAAVIVAWVPGLNVYVAPFLWEMFATRIDRVCGEMLSVQNVQAVQRVQAAQGGVQQSAPA
ncbi:MAG: hypothetical protein JWO86_3738 [Myxococcaceae bacterium]|jgi:hypothetical protein|nr:hypothetical protein [Myxococcaceae bacterium]MEA2750931.1 hypothetical protein [Myxococcales bacterium]